MSVGSQVSVKPREKPWKFKKVLNVSEDVWRELMRRKIDGGYKTVDAVLRDLLGLPQVEGEEGGEGGGG
jgi:hypothetical protein